MDSSLAVLRVLALTAVWPPGRGGHPVFGGEHLAGPECGGASRALPATPRSPCRRPDQPHPRGEAEYAARTRLLRGLSASQLLPQVLHRRRLRRLWLVRGLWWLWRLWWVWWMWRLRWLRWLWRLRLPELRDSY